MLTWLDIFLAFVLVSLTAFFIGTPHNGARVASTRGDRLQADSAIPNTTVVLLNWSRFANDKNITSTICGHLLGDTIQSIIVWNNNPLPLSFSDFVDTTCPQEALKIINSPENLYFEARYVACAQADTLYCFIQDDDYLVRPEIIQALALRISVKSQRAVHLQPPDEMLSSQLRTVVVNPSIRTTFAWLGYGTIIRRSSAVEFLDLIDKLQLSDEEHKMADNYFTILSNDIPEKWFDPGIPLGGGQPFTVGAEGEERNNRHIIRAARFLEYIMRPDLQSLGFPYVRFPLELEKTENISRAPCQGRLCVFETSIRLLPERIDTVPVSAVTEILKLEKNRLRQLGETGKLHYLQFPPSNAVDGQYETAFRSAESAKFGDWIMLDLIRPVLSSEMTFVLVVGLETETVLLSSIFEISRDGEIWNTQKSELKCTDVDSELGMHAKMCRTTSEGYVRRFRVRLLESMQERWVIHEMYVDSK